MILSDPKAPFVFGVVMIGLLAIYLVLFHAMPGPLARPHAEAIIGSGLGTCDRCHTDGGLTPGCLAWCLPTRTPAARLSMPMNTARHPAAAICSANPSVMSCG